MKKIAVFPGSFDPITVGHEGVIIRGAALFDELIVAVGDNADKKNMFSIKKRIEWLEIVTQNLKNVKITSYKGLTIDFCKKNNVNFLLRGLRTSADFEFERCIAQANKMLYPAIENIFLLSLPEHSAVSSSVVRDILKNNGNVDKFVPKSIIKLMKQ